MQKLVAHRAPPSDRVGVAFQAQPGRSAQLEIAAAIGRRVCSLLDRRQLAFELADLLRQRYGYDLARLFLWSAVDRRLVALPTDLASSDEVDLALADAGPLADVVESTEPVLLLNVHGHLQHAPDPAWPETRARAIVPILFGNQVIAVLDLHDRRPMSHPLEELIGLQALAEHVGIALHNCELYAEALRARRQAEAADRLKSRLLANVSHELRAPLNVILGYSQAALAAHTADGAQLNTGLRRDLEHIYASGEHLKRLINDLLDVSRAEVGALELFLEVVAPAAFLEDVFQSASSHADAPPNVTWRLDLPPRLPAIHADPVRLRQVLDNLLNNARACTATGEIVLGARVEDRYLHVWVKDTGEGIAPEQQERIFEPFVSGQRTDRRRTGIGLGLTITRRLVALHGGTLTLDSEPGQGTTFHVRWPLPAAAGASDGNISVLLKPAPSQAVLGALEALQPAAGEGSVLVVDDDPEARELYSRLAGEALPHCTVRTVDNGAAALQVLDEHDPPTLVILDLALPEIDGFAVLERLRSDRRTRHVPVLVISGRLLSQQDVRRLDHSGVLYQAKHLLTPTEALAVLQGAAGGAALLPQPTSAVVKQAMAYLHEYYGRSFGRHDLAQAAGVSDNYLSQIFHRELGVSPRDYLNRVRIHKAKELLSTTDESIMAIASHVGFEDSAYFSRVFHRLVGESPQTYRQRN
jgi:signal transduction histidine kinase/AraC-like DNA-binding protein